MPQHAIFHTVTMPSQPELGTAGQLLQMNGPRIQVALAVPAAQAAQMSAAGQTVPPPSIGYGLIDTGASNTSIDDSVAQHLGLPIIDRINVSTPAGVTPHSVYPVSIFFPGTHLPPVPFQSVGGMALMNQGIIALIGRDFLTGKVLHYDGNLSLVTIMW